ncbi:MAG: hypothetical protein GX640_08895 [Fibrobacter sp.]|nr:hypothetical protein [Fibrobacter sp.]
MQLPKTRRKPKIREKKCANPGCENTFYGIHAAKYCEEHRDPKTRVKEKPPVEDVSEKNHVFQHKFNAVQTMVLKCALEGCNEQFEIKVYPKQFVYPKYCPEHRNEHKRQKHLMSIKAKAQLTP